MLDRNRGKKLALEIGLVATLVVVAVATALARPVEGHDVGEAARGRASHQETQAESKNDGQPSASVAVQNGLQCIAGALEAANNKQQTSEEKSDAKRDLQAQEAMARWAAWMLVVGGAETILTTAGVILIWLTLIHTKRAADAAHNAVAETKRIGEAQTRAYVSCAGATYMVMGGTITIWPIFKNTGQSPARQINIEAVLTAWDEGFRKRYDFEEATGIAPPIPATLSDNGMLTFSRETDAPDPMAFLEKDMDFSIRGIVRWKDVFGGQDSMAFTLMREGDSKVFGEGDRRYRTGNMNALNRTPLTTEEIAEDDAIMAASENGDE